MGRIKNDRVRQKVESVNYRSALGLSRIRTRAFFMDRKNNTTWRIESLSRMLKDVFNRIDFEDQERSI